MANLEVAALQLQNGGVAQDIHIGRRAVKEHLLL